MRTTYTVGFLHNDRRVVLICKNRPEWQAGRLNGIGGHVEDSDASPLACQVREFQEETGVLVPAWDHFLTLEGAESQIYCYAAYDAGGWMDKVATVTDERVITVLFNNPSYSGYYRLVPNLAWILPLMRQRGNYEPVVVNFYGD